MAEVLTLYELNNLVSEVVRINFDDPYWVTGELSDASAPAYGGHFYGELVQKDEQTDRIVARARITCWARTYGMLRLRFQQEAGETLRKGLQVKLLVKVTFHEQYGYSLNVLDIDSSFTMGGLAKRRREILLQLERDGILHDNQNLPLPRLLRRIAVVSSATAAGYGDFCHQLSDNPYGFQFHVQLFPAIMQGEGVSQSIIAALEEIYSQTTHPSPLTPHYDCVVIIRGGGATSDMSGFDTLELAENVANFPLPIITGIGHDRDESILDMVSHTRVKTPTAAATLLIDHLKAILDTIEGAQSLITHYAQQKLSTFHAQLSTLSEAIPRLFSIVKTRHEARLDTYYQRITHQVERRLTSERHKLELVDEKLRALDPALLLKRGYSITLKDGKAVRDAQALQKGDEIETRLANGTIHSTVNR